MGMREECCTSGWDWGIGAILVVIALSWLLFLVGLMVVARRGMQKAKAISRTLEGEPPLEVVKRRYAHGEIDREEFEQKKRDLAL